MYWNTWHNLIELTLSDAVEKAARHFGRLVEQARYRLSQRFDGLPRSAAEEWASLKSFRTAYVHVQRHMLCLPRECPACRNLGVLATGAPNLIMKGSPGKARPIGFFCLVCYLQFWTPEELTAAGMDELVPLVDEQGNRLLSEAEEALWHSTRPEPILFGMPLDEVAPHHQ